MPASLLKRDRDEAEADKRADERAAKRLKKSNEALEAARAAGPAPPVGSWWERSVSFGASIGLGGFGAWLNLAS